jgi:class 3 adenylate cyclase
MAYWFDEECDSGFCLVHAPDAAAAERVHREAHGEIVNAIIPVDPVAVEAFLGRIGDPRTQPGAAGSTVDSGLWAVMFTDIVRSTEMTSRLGDSAALELVRAHDAWCGADSRHTGA